MRKAFTIFMIIMLALGILVIAFRVGMLAQKYYDLKDAGREPYASFEQRSNDGRLEARCDVFEVQEVHHVEYR